jgi:hypothetical protein
MKSWNTSDAYAQSLLGAVASPVYREALTAAAGRDETGACRLPGYLCDWLARLRLLYGVPFDYLVPDERLLPKESIRFFYVDRNWTDRLVDGALSVGKTSTREFAHHHAVKEIVSTALDHEERRVRWQLHPTLANPGLGDAADITGFLLRSFAVAGWPGLEVKAYLADNPGPDTDASTMNLLRMERLAPDVLLCLFDGVPRTIDIEEPREGIQCGIEFEVSSQGRLAPSSQFPSGFSMTPRHTTGTNPGEEIAMQRLAVPVRDMNGQVLHIHALKQALDAALPSSEPKVTSAELGVHLLQFPYRQRFKGAGRVEAGDSRPPFVLDAIYENATVKVFAEVGDLEAREVEMLFPDATLSGDDADG